MGLFSILKHTYKILRFKLFKSESERKKMEFRGIGQNVNIPLYKYYGNVEYAKDVIKNSRIHLEKPKDYNDIYEACHAIYAHDLKRLYSYKFLEIPIIRNHFKDIADEKIKEVQEKKLSVGETIDYLCDINKFIDKEELVKKTIDFYTKETNLIQAQNNKISCFSEINDSLLMWGYYANSYSGVCIRFNAREDDLLNKYCRKVQYTNHFVSDNTFGQYFRKSIQWSHEQEWRIVVDTEEEYLPVKSVDAIYLGVRVKPDIAQIFVDLAMKYNLEVYKMKLSHTKYEIIFDKIL